MSNYVFFKILCVTLKEVRNIIENKRLTNSGMCKIDNRGKHSNHIQTDEKDKQIIRNHINMFPSFESHYSRSHSEKKYLNLDLSISKLYRLYKNNCDDIKTNAQSELTYRKVFVEEYNLSFKKPNNDTCNQCDEYEMLMKTATDDETRIKAETNKNGHLEMAYKEKTYLIRKKKDKDLSVFNSNITTISFDLQKCLSTPMLLNSVSFYKRQL